MIVPMILSGGSGTRLWPPSRAMYLKQFIRFFNGEGRSLLGGTLERVGWDQNFSAPIVVCNNDHRFLVREESPALMLSRRQSGWRRLHAARGG